MASPYNIVFFWFGSDFDGSDAGIKKRNSCEYINSRMPLWFSRSSPEFEAKQREFLQLIDDSTSTEVREDPAWNCSVGLLARVILFDQLPRSIYRGSAKAFEYDSHAVESVLRIIKNGWYTTKYSAIERLFVVLSFQHSEDLELQNQGLLLASQITDGVEDEAVQSYFKNLKGFPMEHYDVFRRFGRFPGRNIALNRVSTQEEIDWLESPECPAWAKSQMVTKSNS